MNQSRSDADYLSAVKRGDMDTAQRMVDETAGRANMDIQGVFFSPWDIDAGGYGSNVRAFYLNITNPADESTGYKALNSHKGENYAGIKARELTRFVARCFAVLIISDYACSIE